MAVSVAANPTILPIGSTDYRLPIGIWYQKKSLTGDVSGGNAEIDIQWSKSSPEVLISIEELFVSFTGSGASTTKAVTVTVTTQERGAENVILAPQWNLGTFVGVPNTTSQQDAEKNLTTTFISNSIAGAWQLSVVYVNVNLEVGIVNAWGYVWDVQARNMNGGPIRPGQFLPPQ